jgi:hypothetical protein
MRGQDLHHFRQQVQLPRQGDVISGNDMLAFPTHVGHPNRPLPLEGQNFNRYVFLSYSSSPLQQLPLNVPVHNCQHEMSHKTNSNSIKYTHKFESTFLPKNRDSSSVGIATRYGLDGPRIESRCEQVLPHPSRPALGRTQPPIQRVTALFPEGKAANARR